MTFVVCSARQLRMAAIAGLLLVTLAIWAPSASAGKAVVGSFGSGGAGSSQFDAPAGLAVNGTTGGVYVVDADNQFAGESPDGNRIAQFDQAGPFVRAWGWGVQTGANAFEVCTAVCRGGIPGQGAGQLSVNAFDDGGNVTMYPQLAVHQSDGSVYVADTGNDRIQKFAADGTFILQFGSTGSGEGQMEAPQGVAVDPVSGDVYVADTDNNRVQRYTSAGTYLAQIGAPGGGAGEGDFNRPTRLAVDAGGRLYVVDAGDGSGRVQRFGPAGDFQQLFAAGAVNAPKDVAVDLSDDHVYILGFTADFTAAAILEFSGDGSGVDTHAPNGVPVVLAGGMAFDPASERLLVSEPTAHRVLVVDDVLLPTVEVQAATDVTARGATLHGIVNPQGSPETRYRFEYSTDGGTWTPVPDSEGVSVGTGTSDVEVASAVEDLEPNTAYRVRLRADKAFNAGGAISAEETFTTDAAPPSVRRLPAGNVTESRAWLAGEINPQKSPTTYFIEYGLTPAYGSRLPAQDAEVGDGSQFVVARQLAEGLSPATTYHFRLVALNAAGRTDGPDGTFTTRPSAPPAPDGRAYEMVSPLDKNGGDINRDLPSGTLATSGAAASGGSVAYAAQAQFADIGSGAPQGQYRSVRGAKGWITRGMNPPADPNPGSDVMTSTIWYLSNDLERAVVGTDAALTPGAKQLLGGFLGTLPAGAW